MNTPPVLPPGYPPSYGYPPPVRKTGMGCFGKGCLTAVIIIVVGGVLGVGALCWYGVSTVRQFITTQPQPVRIYPATPAEYAAVRNRIQTFSSTLATAHTATLALSAKDVNSYIACDPSMSGSRGRFYVTIVGNEMGIECSTAATSGHPGQTVYYLSIRVIFAESFSGGEFTFDVHKVETLGGQPAPALVTALVHTADFSRGFTRSFNEGLRKGLSSNPAAVQFFDRIRSIIIQNGELLVTVVDR